MLFFVLHVTKMNIYTGLKLVQSNRTMAFFSPLPRTRHHVLGWFDFLCVIPTPTHNNTHCFMTPPLKQRAV